MGVTEYEITGDWGGGGCFTVLEDATIDMCVTVSVTPLICSQQKLVGYPPLCPDFGRKTKVELS